MQITNRTKFKTMPVVTRSGSLPETLSIMSMQISTLSPEIQRNIINVQIETVPNPYGTEHSYWKGSYMVPLPDEYQE